MRFLSGRGITLKHTFEDDESVLNPSAVSVTVLAEGAEPVTAQGDGGEGFTAEIDALPPGFYRAQWVGSDPDVTDVDAFEVVDRFLFTVREARAADSDLEDADDYPASEIAGYRLVIETEFETITGRSFIPRRRVLSFEADGTDLVWLGVHDTRALVALSGPSGPLTVSDYHLDANGLLSGLEGFPEGTRLTATVDYGFEFPPADVKRVGFVRLAFLLAAETSGIPDRATSFVAAEGGTFTLATPGRRGSKTGIPDVDAVLSEYTYDVLADVMGA